ncbi:MAG: LysR substrate-binding domain-containing protein [Opitutaceae bacterium]
MPREYQFGFELRHLVYFREVARRLHFRKAAEALALAQPALSRQIRQLEEAVGAPLFVRTSRTVELTPAGAALRDRIEPILRALKNVPAELAALAGGQIGQVRVGFTGLAMATVLPRILREFQKRYPGIRVELNESPTSMQIPALLAGEIACGFFHPDAATPAPGVKTRQLLRERNGVLLPGDHPLAKRARLRMRDLEGLPLVLFPRAHNPGFYDRILMACTRAGFAPQIAEEVWPRANGVGLVRAGIGATFMCPSEARQLPPEVVFRPLEGHAPESTLVCGWLRANENDAALRALIEVVREKREAEDERA